MDKLKPMNKCALLERYSSRIRHVNWLAEQFVLWMVQFICRWQVLEDLEVAQFYSTTLGHQWNAVTSSRIAW